MVGECAATEVFAAVSPRAVPLAGNYLADSNAKKPEPMQKTPRSPPGCARSQRRTDDLFQAILADARN